MPRRKRFRAGGFTSLGAGSLPRAVGKQLCAALREASAYSETLSSGPNCHPLIIQQAGKCGVKIASPINGTRHDNEASLLFALTG